MRSKLLPKELISSGYSVLQTELIETSISFAINTNICNTERAEEVANYFTQSKINLNNVELMKTISEMLAKRG